MSTSTEIFLAFIESINAHDADGLAALLADDHVFIDAHNNRIIGKENVKMGWVGYFEWFPDYDIDVTEMVKKNEVIAAFGLATGSFKGKKNARWQLPVAWRVVVEHGKVKEWQVFADTKVPSEIMEKNKKVVKRRKH